MKRILLSISLLIASLGLFSQSLLWEISGKKLKKPSYLYGTIHIQDKTVFSFDDIVTEKLLETEAFAMELLLDEIDPQDMQSAMLMKNKTLKDIFSEEEYKALDSIVREKTGQGIMIFNKMKPFFLASQLMQLDIKADMAEPLDLYFLNLARKNNKICLGIEKFSEQMAAVDALTYEEQAKMLSDMLNNKDTVSASTSIDDMIEYYISQDLNMLYEVSNDTNLPAAFNHAFLVKRNVKMAKQIGKFAKKHSTFNAIGAAHLPGEMGVINLLRKRGYTLKPIEFSFNPEEENNN